MYAFDFVKPTSLKAALTALQDPEALPLSGGQTLIPTLKQRLAAPSCLVSLTAIPELHGVCQEACEVVIGAATTHAAVARDAARSYPALARLAGQIGDPAVRNRGTIGGSLANNDPSACYPAAALASRAVMVTPTREIAAEDYFQGMFTTALEEGEILTALRFAIPRRAAYVKFAQPASRFALVGVFVADFGDEVRVAVTGAGAEGVFRWAEAEEALGADFTLEAVTPLALPEVEMIGDLHGSPAYRAHLVGVMTRRAVQAALLG
jgi:aerobic carbon-monoxide dehydrogenase medium subunit